MVDVWHGCCHQPREQVQYSRPAYFSTGQPVRLLNSRLKRPLRRHLFHSNNVGPARRAASRVRGTIGAMTEAENMEKTDGKPELPENVRVRF